MQEPTKSYFQVQRPYHFKTHPSLIDELGIAERMHAHLPQTHQQYQTWLKSQELTPEQAPYEGLIAVRSQCYQVTPRYVLWSVIQPGRLGVTNLITDGNYWTIWTEPEGIMAFVQNRAAEFATYHGMDFTRALEMFRPRPPIKAQANRIWPEWGIGYETATGKAIILAISHKETPRRFLEGRDKIYSPFQGED